MAKSTGLKTKFQRESAVPGVYVDIASVASITPPQLEREVAEVEDLDPADGVKEKLPGIIDAGEVTLTLNFDPGDGGHQALQADFYDGETRNYRIVLPPATGADWTFAGFVSGFSPSEISSGDVIQAEVKFTVTRKPEFSVEASAGLTAPYFAISGGADIVPEPADDVYDYVATVGAEVESVTVTTTATTGTITVNSSVVLSGEPSSAIALGEAGSITPITIAVKEDGKTPVVYIVRVLREAGGE